MKKGFVAITAAVAIAATFMIGTAVAGINPSTFGLPDVSLTTSSPASLQTTPPGAIAAADADFYQLTATVAGAKGSVMCVACHTRNPAKRTKYGNAYLGHNGSHFVTSNFADTSPGGGYTDGTGTKERTQRTTARYLASASGTVALSPDLGATAPANAWKYYPKYGKLTSGAIDNNILANGASLSGAQMICESCHNIVHNIGPAKLLATGFANGSANGSYTLASTQGVTGFAPASTTPDLCIGCHGQMGASVNAEWNLHPTSATWSGTHHHRNTGTANYYGLGAQGDKDTMQYIGQNYYDQTNALQMWGANYGELKVATRSLTYDPGTNKKMKNIVDNTTGANSQIYVKAAGQVLCTNCHRAHNGASSSGATILMVTDTTTAIGALAAVDNGTMGMGTYTGGGRGNFIKNTNPLCLACHE